LVTNEKMQRTAAALNPRSCARARANIRMPACAHERVYSAPSLRRLEYSRAHALSCLIEDPDWKNSDPWVGRRQCAPTMRSHHVVGERAGNGFSAIPQEVLIARTRVIK